MSNSPEETARRKAAMEAAGRRADALFDDVTREHQSKIAEAIGQSVADAAEAVPAGEAADMLDRFDEETR
jgi:hypothetical protein